MSKSISEVKLDILSITDEQAKMKDLQLFIKEDREIDGKVYKKFPLKEYGRRNEKLRIYGSKSLFKAFGDVNDNKLDLSGIPLNSIRLEGFNEKNQLILRFLDKELGDVVAEGEYTFTNDFYEHFFKMKSFAKYCFKEAHYDLLSYCTRELLNKNKRKRAQYRLIMDEERYSIRGLTSTGYKNFDNHLAIYLSFLTLHNYAKQQGFYFKVIKANLSDTNLEIYLEQISSTIVSDKGKLYFGAYISNNEVGKKSFSIDLNYRFVDNEGESFRAVSNEKLVKINHRNSIDNAEIQLDNLKKIKQMKEETLEQIHYTMNNPTVDENTLYEMVYREINRKTKAFTPETRKRACELYDEKHINHTMSIIKVFKELSKITNNDEEKLSLERIYHDSLLKMNARKREKEKIH
ncbi:hypothetical protein A6P54_17770 [Bacillus sp. MKU004]|nr:hypothetical protein A6P54_17770 [Bacillus sp. MKU004]